MADLKETDEEVGKAGKGMIRGGSSRLASRIGMERFKLSQKRSQGRGKKTLARLSRAREYAYSRTKYGPRPDKSGLARTGVYKSADPISTLYAEIEKARSAFSGGSSKAFNRVGRIGMRAIKDGDTSRFSRASAAQRYLARRKRNAFRGGENWRTSLPKLRGGKYK